MKAHPKAGTTTDAEHAAAKPFRCRTGFKLWREVSKVPLQLWIASGGGFMGCNAIMRYFELGYRNKFWESSKRFPWYKGSYSFKVAGTSKRTGTGSIMSHANNRRQRSSLEVRLCNQWEVPTVDMKIIGPHIQSHEVIGFFLLNRVYL
ncbi:hypothetical protein CTI12_AA313440 [Artemisia annua]|uniref:Uncharacterized protein n=1 Tax=Artemisia annua TaxID=35608 RepID=A0A2U1N335_ARTAN|nr:hypothetical protein CTI12_AA313440 [Artemisia annua]